MKAPKPILNPAQITQAMTSERYGKERTCSRCFGFLNATEESNGPFCYKCLQDMQAPVNPGTATAMTASAINIAAASKGEMLLFPWVTDPLTGIVRMLTDDEICINCGQAARVGQTQTCGPCGDGLDAIRRSRLGTVQGPTPGTAAFDSGSIPPIVWNTSPGIPVDSAFTLYSNGDPVVTVRRDGSVDIAQGYTPDEAAKAFWEALGRNNPGAVPTPPAAEPSCERDISFED